MEIIVGNDFMVTINVYPKKIIKDGKTYCQYSNDDQKEIIQGVCKVGYKNAEIKHNFELTKAGNIHTHFMLMCTTDDMEILQAYVHSKLGLPCAPADRVCMYSLTRVHKRFGEIYCSKEQDAVIEDSIHDSPDESIYNTNVFKPKRSLKTRPIKIE